MHAVGYNILPRNGIDWTALETHYERHYPSISVVFLEPSAINRLRAKSPNTLYIYRHHIPGFDNDDDGQDRMDAVAFVDMLHGLAPAGEALYLGNEPTGNWGKLASWTIAALNRCDQLGRTGVALNLAYGNPEPEVWKRELKPVLDRIANTRHILGLHEYFASRILGKGYWTQRWVGHIPQNVKVAITELGALEHVSGAVLNARKGWRRLPNYPANAYAADIRAVVDDYRRQPNFIGAAIFSVGVWEGCEVGKEIFDEMEQYDGEITVTQPTPPESYGQKMLGGKLTLVDASKVNFRSTPDTTRAPIAQFEGGEWVNFWSNPVDGWRKVEFGGAVGFVAERYTAISGGLPAPDSTTPVFSDLPVAELLGTPELRRQHAQLLRLYADYVEHGAQET